MDIHIQHGSPGALLSILLANIPMVAATIIMVKGFGKVFFRICLLVMAGWATAARLPKRPPTEVYP